MLKLIGRSRKQVVSALPDYLENLKLDPAYPEFEKLFKAAAKAWGERGGTPHHPPTLDESGKPIIEGCIANHGKAENAQHELEQFILHIGLENRADSIRWLHLATRHALSLSPGEEAPVITESGERKKPTTFFSATFTRLGDQALNADHKLICDPDTGSYALSPATIHVDRVDPIIWQVAMRAMLDITSRSPTEPAINDWYKIICKIPRDIGIDVLREYGRAFGRYPWQHSKFHHEVRKTRGYYRDTRPLRRPRPIDNRLLDDRLAKH